MKHFLILTLILGTILFVSPTQAEDAPTPTEQPQSTSDISLDSTVVEEKPLQAEAGADKNIAIGRNVLFDASASTGPTDHTLTYTWDFGDGQQFQGIDASHIYSQPGVYKAKLTISDGNQTSHDTVLVSVAKEVVLLLADSTVPKDSIKQFKQLAIRDGVLLVVKRPQETATTTYAMSQSLAQQLIAVPDDLNQAKTVIVWTSKNIGLTALTEVDRIFTANTTSAVRSPISLKQKTIIQIDDHPTSLVLARLAQNTFNILQPTYILLTTPAAMPTILADAANVRIFDVLKNQEIPYRIIGSHSQRVLDKITPFNFVSYGINYLINQGVSQDTLFLLLVLPIVATLIAFARQVVGVQAFGIYVPSIITLAFVITQLKYGLLIFLVLLATATLARIGMRYLRLLYLPRMAIVLTIVALAIFIMFAVAAYFKQSGFLSISIFPILVMVILTEKFVEAQIEQGNKAAVILTIETLALAVISYLIITWDTVATLILAYPEIIIGLTIIINIILGRFSGLRVLEYFRFRKLLKQTS